MSNTTTTDSIPTTSSVPEGARVAVQGCVLASTAAASLVTTTPLWGLHGARTALILGISGCPKQLDGEERLELLVHPTRIAIGDLPTRQYAGALVGTGAILLFILTLQVAFAFVAWVVVDEPIEATEFELSLEAWLLRVGVPAANLPGWLLFIQPLVMLSLVVLSQSASEPDRFLGGCAVLITVLALAGTMAVQLTGQRFSATFVLFDRRRGDDGDRHETRAGDDGNDGSDDDDEDGCCSRGPLVRPGHWVPCVTTPMATAAGGAANNRVGGVGDGGEEDSWGTRDRMWFGAMMPLVRPYRGDFGWFAMVEVCGAVGFGLGTAMRPTTLAGCATKMSFLCFILVVLFFLHAWLRPYATTLDNTLVIALTALELLACLFLLGLAARPEDTPKDVFDAAHGISVAVAVLSTLATIKDCVLTVLRGRRAAAAANDEASALAPRSSTGDYRDATTDRQRHQRSQLASDDDGRIRQQPRGTAAARHEPATAERLPASAVVYPPQLETGDDTAAAAVERIRRAASAPDTEWAYDEYLEYMHHAPTDVHYDGESGHFYDTRLARWYDPEAENWYDEEDMG